jgi:NitT/TauT family transport system substrate-binding protein
MIWALLVFLAPASHSRLAGDEYRYPCGKYKGKDMSEPKTLRIVENAPSIFYTPILATVTAGFLRREGYIGELGPYKQGMSLLKRANEGLFQVIGTSPTSNFGWYEKGMPGDPPVQVATINRTDGFYIVSREPYPAFSWADLMDCSLVSSNFATQPWAAMLMLFREKGVDPGSIELLDDYPDMASATQAFREGLGDYLHVQQPYASQVQEDGLGIIVASVGRDLGPLSFSTLAMSVDFIEKDPDAAKAFMRAYVNCRRWLQVSNPEDIVSKVEHLFPDFSHRALVRSVQGYKAIGAWDADPRIKPRDYERMVDMWVGAGYMTERYPYDKVVYSRLADAYWEGE